MCTVHMCDERVQTIFDTQLAPIGVCMVYMWACVVSSLLPTGPTHWPTLSLPCSLFIPQEGHE